MKSVITSGPVICTKLCPCQAPVGNSAIMIHTYNNKKIVQNGRNNPV